jgi:lysyl-tRNA synthetase class 1
MSWLNTIVDEVIARRPEGEIVVSSGVSPSGTYHLGTLREVLTAEIIAVELRRRGRQARHVHVVDDLDSLRKIPVNVSDGFEQYLGRPLCDVPAPDGSDRSYADFFLADLLEAAQKMHLTMEVVRSHEKYREGAFVPAIERALEHVDDIRHALEDVAGRQLDDQWSPIQVLEGGYLKNRQFVSIDTAAKTVTYAAKEGETHTLSYAHGEVKLNWRIDWPARWWLYGVHVEPFGRDHATKGGSYDTGSVIARAVYDTEPPLPVPYDFINRTGETKKMSKSAGNVITAAELLHMLPPEIVWFLLLRYAPDKLIFFDEGDTLIRLFDEFAALLAKPEKTPYEQQLIDLCRHSVEQPTVSNVPFSHLVASYQAALKDAGKTLAVIGRTEYVQTVAKDADTITRELHFIDQWLTRRAPDDVKFELLQQCDPAQFTESEKKFLIKLGDKVATAPEDADGAWFHNAIYELKDELSLAPKEIFTVLYRALIGKESGPRAGWFLSILPRDWLTTRLHLDTPTEQEAH